MGKDFLLLTTMELNKEYWENRYTAGEAGWDIGAASTPIKEYIDQLKSKEIQILIPGCGSAHEADYLVSKGFTNITLLDLASNIIQQLKDRFAAYPNVRVITEDFFTHKGQYDLVIEQTFFCAFNPDLRGKYYPKMHSLLKPKGKIAGVMFGIEFEKQGPPFGGNANDYKALMKDYFVVKTMELCYNSIPKRQGNELFLILEKKD